MYNREYAFYNVNGHHLKEKVISVWDKCSVLVSTEGGLPWNKAGSGGIAAERLLADSRHQERIFTQAKALEVKAVPWPKRSKSHAEKKTNLEIINLNRSALWGRKGSRLGKSECCVLCVPCVIRPSVEAITFCDGRRWSGYFLWWGCSWLVGQVAIVTRRSLEDRGAGQLQDRRSVSSLVPLYPV